MNTIKKIIKKILLLLSFENQKNIHIKNLLNNKTIIAEATASENLIMETSLKYSMTPKVRMWALLQSIKYILNLKIEGDIVETGVFQGGNLILCQKLLDIYEPKTNRKIFGYDTFEGMTEPTQNDRNIFGEDPKNFWKKSQKESHNDWCYASIEEVRRNFIKETNFNNSLKLIKGPVEETLAINKNLPNKISLLRLDTDWYQSSKKELEILYPKLVVGGVLIIDDYGHWQGVKKSVDEYFKDQKIWLHYVDYGCRLLIKKAE
tara:strand:+ start:2142 stop:2927 length:786 start_codon:yes stop_codon:yes gene_type:complete